MKKLIIILIVLLSGCAIRTKSEQCKRFEKDKRFWNPSVSYQCGKE